MLGHNVPKPASLLRIFRTGNLIEEVNVDVMRNAKILGSTQGKIEIKDGDGILVRGAYDAIIEHPVTKEFYLVEIKSINEMAFDKLPAEHEEILAGESPIMTKYPKYIHQWNTYAYGTSVYRGFLLFEAKNTQKQKIYHLKFDSVLWEENLIKLKQALLQNRKQQIVAVPDGMKPNDALHNICGRCDQRYLCVTLPIEEVSFEEVRKKDATLRG